SRPRPPICCATSRGPASACDAFFAQRRTMNDARWQDVFRSCVDSSFMELLRRDTPHLMPAPSTSASVPPAEVPHGTTVIAVRYRDGVIMAGDRQATAGYQVASRRIEKIFKSDDLS